MKNNISGFIEKFQEQLENGEVVLEETIFRDEIDSWDSLTSMAVLAMIEDEYGIVLDDIQFESAKTIRDLFNLITI